MCVSRPWQIKTHGQPAERGRQCVQNAYAARGKVKCLTAFVVMYPCFMPDDIK